MGDPRAILCALSGRKRHSSNWSSSRRHRTPAARYWARSDGHPRGLSAPTVYADSTIHGVYRNDGVLEGMADNAREMRSRCMAKKDGIKSGSSVGS